MPLLRQFIEGFVKCRNCKNRFQSMCGVLNFEESDLLEAMIIHKNYEPQATLIDEDYLIEIKG